MASRCNSVKCIIYPLRIIPEVNGNCFNRLSVFRHFARMGNIGFVRDSHIIGAVIDVPDIA